MLLAALPVISTGGVGVLEQLKRITADSITQQILDRDTPLLLLFLITPPIFRDQVNVREFFRQPKKALVG